MASSSTFILHDNLLLVLATPKTLQIADETLNPETQAMAVEPEPLNRETLPERRRFNTIL